MRVTRILFALLLALPVASFAAAEAGSSAAQDQKFHVINKQIDTWVDGKVTNIDAAKGTITIHGSEMPFATTHAEMRQDMQKRTAGIDDKEQRAKIALQVRKEWQDKLQAAKSEKKGEAKDYSFKKPADDGDLVVLNESNVRDLPFFQRMAERRERRAEGGREIVVIGIYQMPESGEAEEAAQPTSYDKSSAKPGERAAEMKEKVKDRLESKSPEQKEAMKERMQERAGERRERREASRDKLEAQRKSFSDLKVGDEVVVGFDKDSNTAFTFIIDDVPGERAQPTSAQQPAKSSY
jgi:hypothetical protein